MTVSQNFESDKYCDLFQSISWMSFMSLVLIFYLPFGHEVSISLMCNHILCTWITFRSRIAVEASTILLVWVTYSFLFKPSFTRITVLTFPNEPWQLIIIVKEWLQLLSLRYLIQSSQDICHEMLRYFPTGIQNQNKQ